MLFATFEANCMMFANAPRLKTSFNITPLTVRSGGKTEVYEDIKRVINSELERVARVFGKTTSYTYYSSGSLSFYTYEFTYPKLVVAVTPNGLFNGIKFEYRYKSYDRRIDNYFKSVGTPSSPEEAKQMIDIITEGEEGVWVERKIPESIYEND